MKNSNRIKKAQAYLTLIYLGVMLGFFPIYFKYEYNGMGNAKHDIFQITTAVYVALAGVLILLSHILEKKKLALSKLDCAVLFYFSMAAVSFFLSPYKKMALFGASGWSMGFLTLILLVGSYFFISKGETTVFQNKSVLSIGMQLLLASSAVVFVVAILHRFDVDPLHIYGNVHEQYKTLFLSTMGQSSWYSSFLCTVWPLGVYLFYLEQQKKRKWLLGGYVCLGAMSLVTQNTDTAFLSLFVVVLILFFQCQQDGHGMERFLQTVLIILGSFLAIGALQRIFASHMILIDALSLQISQGIITLLLFAGVALLYGYFTHAANRGKEVTVPKGMRWGVVVVVLLLLMAGIFLIVLNTNGVLQALFGVKLTHQYLYFDDMWGNMRGFSWKLALNCFLDFPFVHKLVGIGPDCFSAYYQDVEAYRSHVAAFFGGLILTNAHNEYLTKLVDIGILGLVSYLLFFITAILQFVRARKHQPVVGAFVLVVGAYMTHNLFCYEQVCCTPIFFILIAIGNKLSYNDVQK